MSNLRLAPGLYPEGHNNGYVDNSETQLPTYPQPLLLRRIHTPLPLNGRNSESEKGR